MLCIFKAKLLPLDEAKGLLASVLKVPGRTPMSVGLGVEACSGAICPFQHLAMRSLSKTWTVLILPSRA